MLYVPVDKLLVRDVDKRTEEDGRCSEKAETPEWKNLDEVVSEKCCDEGLQESVSIISFCSGLS